jgi:hypothetical protein
MRNLLIILLMLETAALNGQQNQQLFQMHYLGESNFLNPAVQSECKWFIGLPVISSVHLNLANSAASYRQLVTNTSDSTAQLNIDKVVNRLGLRTLIETEIHATLLALGYKLNDYYFAFSIIEKNNIPITLSKDIFALAWKGNTQFEGEHASTRGTSIYATHYREYAFGISRQNSYGNFLGIKGKLLFGKLNLSVPKSNISLYTDPTTFDLTLDGDLRINASAPLIIDQTDGRINTISFDENASIRNLIFNRKNWGFAFDAGFIRRMNEKITLSGSILDVGFIRWRSYLNNLSATDAFTYQGVLADTGNVTESLLDSLTFDVTNNAYTTMLPIKTYLGANYTLMERLDARATGSAVFYRTKIVPALTLGLDYNPFGHFHLVASYSVMYRAFNNVGLGFSLGRGPLQFYMISDNAAGMILPLSARNINLRFGLNINLGCRSKEDKPERTYTGYGKCAVYQKAEQRQKRKAGWNKR